ncbi:arginine N-succinyltransferase, partial [Pseudomonas aeruginosa]|nr:arginine N-succinyltransferase [Pseudomonas aeruginosa]
TGMKTFIAELMPAYPIYISLLPEAARGVIGQVHPNTAPVMTPLLTFAAARGCKVQTGPEMALAQMRLMGQFIGAIPQAQGAAA